MYILDLYIINHVRLNLLRETCSLFLQLKAAVISDNFFFMIILLLECANSSQTRASGKLIILFLYCAIRCLCLRPADLNSQCTTIVSGLSLSFETAVASLKNL